MKDDQDNRFIISVDIGTTETKSVLVGTSGLVDSLKLENKIDFPQHGYAEQDPSMLENSIVNSIKKLLEKRQDSIEQIQGLIFTSQMQGILPVDSSGTCFTKLITWMDTRAADITKEKLGKGFPKISGYPLKYLIKFYLLQEVRQGTMEKIPCLNHFGLNNICQKSMMELINSWTRKITLYF
jgi:sugar (pentulose or hexulose) kinase